VQYRSFIHNRFSVREVLVAALTDDAPIDAGGGTRELEANVVDAPGAAQDRSTCCGTMQLDEYMGIEEAMQKQLEELKRSMQKGALQGVAKTAHKM
jgi:hypothetical protein